MGERFDVVIFSNGPGEISTWVRPVMGELVDRLPGARVSLVLAPDGNSSGTEHQMATLIPGIDRVQPARHYLRFLLTGRTAERWDWSKRGIALFLGGDQGLSALIARRLGYPIVVYAEWQARWTPLVDRFGLREEAVRRRSGRERFRGQFEVVGDLMIDAARSAEDHKEQVMRRLAIEPGELLLAVLPGSKPAKLSLGIPLFLGLAERLVARRSRVRLVLPVAPGLNGADLERFARRSNPDLVRVAGSPGALVSEGSDQYLVTEGGARLLLWFERPAYALLAGADLALTTVGANTAELGILGVPMLVLVPTNRMDVMRAWDGLPGLLSGLPGRLGSAAAAAINRRLIQRLGLLAWPNIRAGRMLVPELVRPLTSAELVPLVEEWLDDLERRKEVSQQLKQVMGAPGAARAFVGLAESLLRERLR